jgi:cell division protein FtsL
VESIEGLKSLFDEFRNLNESHVATGNKIRIMTVAIKELKAASQGVNIKEDDFIKNDC